MRRIASADLAPPGSLIRPVTPHDPSTDVTVRYASKIASAKERLADLRAAYRGKMASL